MGLGLGLALGLGFAGCSPTVVQVEEPAPCELQKVTSAVITAPYLNPARSGESRPVQVRLYQLKGDVRFQNASFEEVWKKDADVLKDDLLSVQEFPVYPDTRTELSFERNPEAQFVVAAGLFRDPKGKKWFKSFELPPPPGKGNCQLEGEEDAAPELNPKIYVWLQGTKVDDGIEYADYYPRDRTVAAEVTTSAAAEGTQGGDGSGAAK